MRWGESDGVRGLGRTLEDRKKHGVPLEVSLLTTDHVDSCLFYTLSSMQDNSSFCRSTCRSTDTSDERTVSFENVFALPREVLGVTCSTLPRAAILCYAWAIRSNDLDQRSATGSWAVRPPDRSWRAAQDVFSRSSMFRRTSLDAGHEIPCLPGFNVQYPPCGVGWSPAYMPAPSYLLVL